MFYLLREEYCKRSRYLRAFDHPVDSVHRDRHDLEPSGKLPSCSLNDYNHPDPKPSSHEYRLGSQLSQQRIVSPLAVMDLSSNTMLLAGTALAVLVPAFIYSREITRWLRLKNYQYEATFALSMMTPMEKFVISRSLISFPALPVNPLTD